MTSGIELDARDYVILYGFLISSGMSEPAG